MPSAERRQISVLFCDLVGSTALSSRLDPEDLRNLTQIYEQRVAEVMARFGGFVARYIGDGILVYFGWPLASEADAEQALRSAGSNESRRGEPDRGRGFQRTRRHRNRSGCRRGHR